MLPVAPKRTHRKGETFYAGPRAGNLTGCTGIWYFDTRDASSRDLADHLRRIVELLYPEPGNADRVNRLREEMGGGTCQCAGKLLLVWRPGSATPNRSGRRARG